MNLLRATWLVWRSKKSSCDLSMSTYGGPFSLDEQEFLANVSRAQAVDTELKLLARKLPMLQANVARAERELAECQQKIEHARTEYNKLLGRESETKLLTGGTQCQLTTSR